MSGRPMALPAADNGNHAPDRDGRLELKADLLSRVQPVRREHFYPVRGHLEAVASSWLTRAGRPPGISMRVSRRVPK